LSNSSCTASSTDVNDLIFLIDLVLIFVGERGGISFGERGETSFGAAGPPLRDCRLKFPTLLVEAVVARPLVLTGIGVIVVYAWLVLAYFN